MEREQNLLAHDQNSVEPDAEDAEGEGGSLMIEQEGRTAHGVRLEQHSFGTALSELP